MTLDPDTLRIEPLSGPEDLEGVLEVDAASFIRPWTREMYEADLRNPAVSRIFVARTREWRVAGYCAAWFVRGEVHVNNLAVRPECRRQRLGRRLIEHVLAVAEAEGHPRATLEVRRSNHAARRLYEALGFRVAGVRQAYYTDPVEDALVLRRDTPPDAGRGQTP